MSNADNRAAASLRAICGEISDLRIQELLEAANNSLERAVDIFFHQQQEQQHQDEKKSKEHQQRAREGEESANHKKRSSTTPQSSPAKQARLDSFFGNKSAKAELGTKRKVLPRESLDEVIAIDDDEVENDVTTVWDTKCGALESKAVIDPASILSLPLQSKQNDAAKITANITTPTDAPCNAISFQYLSETLQQLADTTKRLLKLDILESFIREVIQHSELTEQALVLTYSLHLILGRRSSDQTPLDVSGGAVSKALQTILGVSRMQLSKAYRKYGDLGDSAASLFQPRSTFFVTKVQSFSVVQVYQSLEKLVHTGGREAKQHILLRLLRSCQSKTEVRFLVRLLIGNMRVGANLKTVLAALARATMKKKTATLTANASDETKQAVDCVQKTHDICPSLEKIVTALLAGGMEQMKRDCGIQLLTPIGPMLAHPAHSLEQVEEAMREQNNSAIIEWKYDGVRCQAHYDGATVQLFSRHMLETTAQYPDAAESIVNAKSEAVISFIIDSEIVGVEGQGESMRLLPFQDLSRRKKNDDGEGVRVKVFAFDLMYMNGISFVDRPLWERKQALYENFRETENFCHVSSKTIESYNKDTIKSFLEEAVQRGAEGLMVKMLGKKEGKTSCSDQVETALQSKSSPYEAGTRSHSWIKVKRDYVAGYADTIDVVPIGAWFGNGRKAQKSFLSPVLLAVYDEEEDVFRSICRCMSFTDDMYEAMREFYFHGVPYPSMVGMEEDIVEGFRGTEQVDESNSDEKELRRDSRGHDEALGDDRVNCLSSRPSSAFVITNESPSIWFKQLEVFEVSFADMTLSRQHTAAAGYIDDSEGRGIALRFPRFKRRRPDKKPEQATTCAQIAQLFANQSKQGGIAPRGGQSR